MVVATFAWTDKQTNICGIFFLPLGVIAWDFENTTNHCDHHPSPLPRAQGCQKTTLGIIVENPNRENVFFAARGSEK